MKHNGFYGSHQHHRQKLLSWTADATVVRRGDGGGQDEDTAATAAAAELRKLHQCGANACWGTVPTAAAAATTATAAAEEEVLTASYIRISVSTHSFFTIAEIGLILV